MKSSTGARLAAIALTALLLTGCVRIHADTSIGSNDTFSQAVIIAFTDAAASQVSQQAGVNLDDLTGGLRDSAELKGLQAKYPDQISIEDYTDEDLNGIEVTITDLPLSEFNGAASQLTSGLGVSASIERMGDEYVVTMAAPAAGGRQESGSGDDPLGGLDLGSLGLSGANLAALGSSIDVEVTYTFPGLVTEASAGDIDGNTVTLGVSDIVGGDDIRIVGGASDQIDWWPFVKWALIIAAFASVIGGATLLVRQDKRRQRSNTLPAPVVGEPTAGEESPKPPQQ